MVHRSDNRGRGFEGVHSNHGDKHQGQYPRYDIQRLAGVLVDDIVLLLYPLALLVEVGHDGLQKLLNLINRPLDALGQSD